MSHEKLTHIRSLLIGMVCFAFGIWHVAAVEPEWTELITDSGLTGWRPVNEEEPHEWQAAEVVELDPQDQHRFSIRPGNGVLTNAQRAGKTQNLLSEKNYGDLEAHIEFNFPGGSNSGVFFMALYELQVADSYGKAEIVFSDCGGFYARPVDGQWVGGVAPLANACRPAGSWQTYDVKFRAPRFDADGNKTENARFLQVFHNGVLIHRDVEMEGPNSAHLDIPEAPAGPLMLQGDHGPIAYRNVRIREVGWDERKD